MLELAPLLEGGSTVWELVKAGGWIMLPIILCSIAAAAIVAERLDMSIANMASRIGSMRILLDR